MQLTDQRYRAMALEILGDLVRIDTSNPPGNEIACAKYLRDKLEPAGIACEIIESAPGRGNLIARYKGTGQAKAFALMGHMDVVAADPSAWTYPPFVAEIHDGFMWGRGTRDMKHMIAVSTTIMLALAESGTTLSRDLLLMTSADEEQGGNLGMGWLIKNRPDLFDIECAINEGGGSAIRVGDKLFYTCQAGEKGICRTVWTARGPAGHAMQPRVDASNLALAEAVAKTKVGYLNGRAIDAMRVAMQEIANATAPASASQVDRLMAEGDFSEAMRLVGMSDQDVARHLPLFHDTVTVTGLRAGDPQSINVIPSVSRAYADGRILPGQTKDGYLETLRDLAGEGVEIDVYDGQYSPGMEASPDAPIIDTIRGVIADRTDAAGLIPWLCPGATDARHLIPAGVPVYGFVPSQPMPDGFTGGGAHNYDERIWLENLDFALDILYEVVTRFGGAA